jgi:hypothetical protein
MYILSIIGVIVLLLLPSIIFGLYIKKHYKEDIKEIIKFYKDMKPELPSFKKTKVDVKKVLMEIRKQKIDLNK